MSAFIRGPDDRYSVIFDVLSTIDGKIFARDKATTGSPFWDVTYQGGTRGQKEAVGSRPHSYLVVVRNRCSLVVVPGENGLTIRSVKLLDAARAVITAVVTAGPTAPDWLPAESTYRVFDGDHAVASAFSEQYFPFEGMAAEAPVRQASLTALDRLAAAIGQSINQANMALAEAQPQGGGVQISTVTIRVAIDETSVNQGRVLVSLAQAGQTETGQYVELTLSAGQSAPATASTGTSGGD